MNKSVIFCSWLLHRHSWQGPGILWWLHVSRQHCTVQEAEVPDPCQRWRIAGTVQFFVGVFVLRQKNIRTKEKHRNFKRQFKRAWHSFVLSMFCIFDANSLRLLLLIWTKVFCNVTTIAPMPSFLARTRNLMMIVCKCSRWHCAIMDMRSLV